LRIAFRPAEGEEARDAFMRRIAAAKELPGIDPNFSGCGSNSNER
jgi:hypothetical protein